MARSARNTKIDTRSARAKLAVRREPYWTGMGSGLSVGYRRLDGNRGTWIARAYDPGTRKRRYHAIADADDVLEADGKRVLAFNQAQEAARAWLPKAFIDRSDSSDSSDSPPKTVAEALTVYCDWLAAHKKESSAREARSHARRINTELGAIRLDKLTAAHIRRFRDDLASQPARGRELLTETDRRRRRSTVNRLLVSLRAALRHVAARHSDLMPHEPWRGLEPFKNADAARVRWLTVEECKRLLNAAPEDLRRLVRAALLSGCRYGELCRLQCGDFHAASATLHIVEGKAGARTIPLDDEARAFFGAITAGRSPREPVLLKANGRAWGPDDQKRPMAEASRAARLEPPATIHSLRHTYASLRIMAGAPLPAIAAALGHSGTRMVERHYGHLAPSWVAEAIRATSLGIGAGEEAEKKKIERLATA